MKKILASLISILLISSTILMGCGEKRPDAKTASETLIKTVVYNKDTDKFKATFNEDASNYEKEFKNSFISSYKSTFTSSLGIPSSADLDKNIEDLYTALNKKMASTAKYTITVKNETKDAATINVAVTGIDMTKIQAALTDKLKEAVAADPSLIQNKEELGKKVIELYIAAINDAELSSSATDVTVELKASDKKSCWQVSNGETSVVNLIKAFYLGQ